MIPEELEKLIVRHKSEGHLPFFVNCTTGTTVYGAFDPINPIADICERHHIWLHIDVSLANNPLLIAGLFGNTKVVLPYIYVRSKASFLYFISSSVIADLSYFNFRLPGAEDCL